jgi:AcrR family transcriptional regulator
MTSQDTVSRRQTRRAGRGKTAVLEAAARVIAERGADATRFTDVSQASAVPVSTLQYYFGSREDLLVAAFRHASETELARLGPEIERIADPWDRVVRIADAALSGYSAEEGQPSRLWIEAWRFAMRDEEMRADVLRDYAAWRGLIAAAIRAGIGQGRFTVAGDPDQVAALILCMLDGLGMPLALADPSLPAEGTRGTLLATLGAILGHNS